MMPIHARLTRFFALSLAALALTAPSASAQQQGLFQTAITVNDMVITNYELQQRELFLNLLRAPGNPKTEARNGLIDDRLRQQTTQRAGITPSEDQIVQGMEEFAARANLSAEEFITVVGQAGVASETFRDFINAGLAWREFVQGQFGPRSQVSEPEIDRAIALQGSIGGARVRLAEIILPLAPRTAERNQALAQRLSDTISTEGAFSAAARRYSASPTRNRGGLLEWMPLGNVPPQVRATLLTLAPGEVSAPQNLGNAVAVFQLRDLEDSAAVSPETQALDYATVLFPGGRTSETLAQARAFQAEHDTCDDLYTTAKSLPPEYFERQVLPAADVPADIALELAKLDSNEVSTTLTRQNGQFLVYVMLCGRTLEIPLDENGEEIDQRARVRDSLFNQRISSFADSFLDELRADAIIIEQ
ncbi:MAG: peptidylprolyl isomerase [Litoreibacter sp.]|uniref:peptidylprolyl isomerase n=1 Tax=Litoreibacter sp. TaxID=1969459 RepID=UPI003299C451